VGQGDSGTGTLSHFFVTGTGTGTGPMFKTPARAGFARRKGERVIRDIRGNLLPYSRCPGSYSCEGIVCNISLWSKKLIATFFRIFTWFHRTHYYRQIERRGEKQ